MSVRDRWV